MKKLFVGVLGASVIFVASGCMVGGGSLTNLPEEEFALMNLEIRLGKVDAAAPANGGVFAKAAVGIDDKIILRDMVLRFTSNLKDTVWDTAQMLTEDGFNSGGVGIGENDSRIIRVDVKLAPLRWWIIEIATHDTKDSVIHYGKVGPVASKGGQTVTLSVPELNSRYSMYEARYALPEAIYPAGVIDSERVYQKIFFSRLVLSVDSVIVRDSTSFSSTITAAGSRFITATGLKGDPGKFFFKPRGSGPNDITTHVQIYPYVLTGPRKFDIKAYGYLEGDSITMAPRLLFHGSRTVAITAGTVETAVPIVLDYTGPGSTPDPGAPAPEPGEPDWSGITMDVVIGKTGKLTQEVIIPGGVDL